MRRVHLKRRRKKSKFIIFLVTLFLAILISLVSVIHISEELTPTLLSLAEFKLNKYSTAIVNNAVSQVLEDKIDTADLFSVTKNTNGEIQIIDFDPVVVNHILNVATTVVQNNIILLEDGELDTIGIDDMNLTDDDVFNIKNGIAVSLPMGKVLNISLLSNLGPKVPVRFHYIGDVNSNVTTKISQYGVNNALVEIGIHLEMSAQIFLPFVTEVKVLKCDIPIVIKMIQGKVPNFYSGSIKDNSNLYSLPLE